MAIAGLNVEHARNLSVRGCLKEVAAKKMREVEERERRNEPVSPRVKAWMDDIKQRQAHQKERDKHVDANNAKNAKEFEALKEVALEIVKAGYRELSKKHHPDVGGSTEEMRKLTAAKQRLVAIIAEEWAKAA